MTSSGEPRKHHLLSKVLLQEFTDGEGQLTSYDLDYGKSFRRHPSEVGWRFDFVADQRQEMERLWGSTEDQTRAAIRAVHDGTIFQDRAAVETLKGLIALHFMRNERVKRIYADGWMRLRDTYQAPPHFPGNREIFEAVVRHKWGEEHDQHFADFQRNFFVRARADVVAAGLEVVVSADEPVLIGDGAVVSLTELGEGSAVMGFAPFKDAVSHVLPIGPRHLVALGREDRILSPPAEFIRRLNIGQIGEARRHVFYSPSDAGIVPLIAEGRSSKRPPRKNGKRR